MILGVAGHRPQKSGYDAHALRLFAQVVLLETPPDEVITGMAQGWDQAVARACLDIGIPYIAAVPFEGQESRWPDAAQVEYWFLLGGAAKVIHVSRPEYSLAKMHKRNQWIADRVDQAGVLWDGFDDSGTADFVRRARLGSLDLVNYWDRWQEYRSQL